MRYVVIFLFPFFVLAQPYEKTKTRHRFAQTTFGLDLYGMAGGSSVFANTDSTLQNFDISPSLSPRIHAGGLHFWGHLEFYFNINLARIALKKDPVKVKNTVSDVIGVKYFPWAVKFGRPTFYIGSGLTGISFYQLGANGTTGQYNKLVLPATLGLFHYNRKWGYDVSFTYLYGAETKFYASKKMYSAIQTPPFVLNVGIRKMFETTGSAEKDYLSGKEDSVFKMMRKQRKLSSWIVGIAPSSAFYLREACNNASTYDFIGKGLYSIFPEVAVGYYYDPLSVNLVLTSRYINKTKKAFDIQQNFQRLALGFECFWQFANYNGFAPYAGANLSYETLNFKEKSNAGSSSFSFTGFKPGIVMGWDILVSKYQPFTLRTNVRYFPNLGIDIGDHKKMWFDQIEFNFIELLFYPGRNKKISSVWYQ